LILQNSSPKNLHCRIAGEGEPLFLLHGLFGSSMNWRSISQVLEPQFQVFSPDARNHGQSPHFSSMSYEEMADDLLALIQAQGLREVNLVGHSMGGKIAMVFALKYPELVKKLAILDIAPVAYPLAFEDVIESLQALPLKTLKSRRDVDLKLGESIKLPSLRNFLLSNLKNDPQGFSWRINLPVIQESIQAIRGFPELKSKALFTGEVLFYRGENSDYVLDSYQAEIQSFFPGAELKTLPQAGHWMHVENRSGFLQGIQEFLLSDS